MMAANTPKDEVRQLSNGLIVVRVVSIHEQHAVTPATAQPHNPALKHVCVESYSTPRAEPRCGTRQCVWVREAHRCSHAGARVMGVRVRTRTRCRYRVCECAHTQARTRVLVSALPPSTGVHAAVQHAAPMVAVRQKQEKMNRTWEWLS